MRSIQLTEAWFATHKHPHGNGETFNIFVNPTRAEFAKLLRTEFSGDARSCVDGKGNVYVWHFDILHDEVQEMPGMGHLLMASLSFTSGSKDVYWSEFEYYREEGTDDLLDTELREYASVIIDNPNITRMLGKGWRLWADFDDEHITVTWDWINQHVKS